MEVRKILFILFVCFVDRLPRSSLGPVSFLREPFHQPGSTIALYLSAFRSTEHPPDDLGVDLASILPRGVGKQTKSGLLKRR